jgi:hypothetical protein
MLDLGIQFLRAAQTIAYVIGIVLQPSAPVRIDDATPVIHPRPIEHGVMNKHPIHFEIGEEEAKRRLIADIAYFAAESRGFSPGYELDDWLQAEQEVEASLEAPPASATDAANALDTELESGV